jgi:hypothetical protein
MCSYTLGGRPSFKFEDTIVMVPALTYVEIQPGVPYSIANKGQEPAELLAVSVIAPEYDSGQRLNLRDFRKLRRNRNRLTVPQQ